MDIVVAFFILGVFARLVKSDLRLPEALYEALTIYLLIAIGLKGGIELSKQPVAMITPQIVAVVLMGLTIPLLLYPVFRWMRLSAYDAASLGAHFGSVSVVTFAVATATLARMTIPYEGHAAVWVAVMEAPGLVTGVLLARMLGGRGTAADATTAAAPTLRWPMLVHEVLFGKSVILLLGGLLIGTMAGAAGTLPIQPLFVDLFKGVLAIFLLELGLVAGGRIAEVRSFGWRPLAIGTVVPLVLSLVGTAVGTLLDLSRGGVAVMATLAASASYIAAPAVMRIAVPQANSALAITIALGVTFPFNLVVGIPLYIWMAQTLGAWMSAP